MSEILADKLLFHNPYPSKGQCLDTIGLNSRWLRFFQICVSLDFSTNCACNVSCTGWSCNQSFIFDSSWYIDSILERW